MDQYLEKSQSIDQQEEENEQLEKQKQELAKQIEKLGKQIEELEKHKGLLQSTGAGKISPTDLDARIMKARHGKFYAYNVQTVVDTSNHFIVCTEVTNSQNDKGQLQPMIEKAEAVLGTPPQEAIADSGYEVWDQILYLEKVRNIICYVAINGNQYINNQAEEAIKFIYDEKNNYYTCPENKLLLPKHGVKRDSRRKTQSQVFTTNECTGCIRKPLCTTAENRTITKHSDQNLRDSYIARMGSKTGKEKLKQRKSTVEHPFATIKYLMGQIPLILRGKEKVQTEINLYTLAYNLKRLLSIASFEKISEMINQNKLELKTS